MIGQGVTLVTGLPGSGKTAHVVDLLSKIPDRPLYVMGVPELKLEYNICPPVEEWVELRSDPDDPTLKLPYFTFPPNAIVVLDEAQRVYRPRPTGSKVPDIVAAFETRRHTGVDFVLLTQHPTFVDSAIRKLVQRHIHIHCTTLGRYKLEWQGLGDPDASSSRDMAQRERYKPNKKVFELYKSAELHTKPVVKRPWMVYAFVPLVLAVIGGAFYVKSRIDDRMNPQQFKADTGASTPGQNTGTGKGPEKPAILTSAEYIEAQKPRIEGLPHSAPIYDAITTPKEAPEPVGCVTSKKTGCKCYTQQGTAYDTTAKICEQIMTKGLFMPWKEREKIQIAEKPKKAQEPVLAPFVGTLPADKPIQLSQGPAANK